MITNTFNAYGYFHYDIRANVIPESGKETAELLVEILDEGSKDESMRLKSRVTRRIRARFC